PPRRRPRGSRGDGVRRGRRAGGTSFGSVGRAMLTMQAMQLLDLFRDSTSVEAGELVVGGARATDLAREHGTPVVVYDELTLRNQARAYAAAAPGALVAYGTKAFPSVAVLELFLDEGLGADVSTVGELEFAL